MAELANCSRCDRLFLKGTRSICQDCYQEEEKAFQTVYQFMRQRKNRQATMPEIIENTGVDEELIIKFIKEKRLLPSEFPNIGYPCSHCGTRITAGDLCVSCREKLKKDLQQYEQKERKVEEEREKQRTYYMFDD
ncbi:TIGR03826 family flagellar region protein [Virgibacillus pantothenticus]|uniref:TIGR03826 family flagellar region protein n=1 Tax=Virgibacillus pantothenticus TaxID=1473 RepID=UPI000985ED68|nr:TIGR03826 family flagellar region protein [Virgibacillus pantothenticus]